MNTSTLSVNTRKTLSSIDAVLNKAEAHGNLFSRNQLSAIRSIREIFVERLSEHERRVLIEAA